MSYNKPYSALSALSRWPQIWDDDWFPAVSSTTSNGLDVYETDDEIVVKANVAGVPADKVEVTYEDETLLIKAQADEEATEKTRKHYSKSSWSYSYRVALPGKINASKEPDAVVTSGVVTVTFKKSQASTPKRVTVKTK